MRNIVGVQHFTDPQYRKKLNRCPYADLKLVPELTKQEKDQKPQPRPRWLAYCPVATKFVYGLVNVRTDGQLIMCATMLEKGNDFDVKVFRAG